VEQLARWCGDVASAADELPFYYYHIPRMTGVEVPMREFLPATAERAPNLAGVKYSHADLADVARCVALAGGRFDVLFGLDEMLLPALSVGCRGAVGTTYNFAGRLYRRILDAFDRGDLEAARADQRRAAEMIALLHRYGFYSAARCVSGMVGLPYPKQCRAVPIAGQAALMSRSCERFLVLQTSRDEGFHPFACRRSSAKLVFRLDWRNRLYESLLALT